MSSRQVHPNPRNGQPTKFQVKTYSTETGSTTRSGWAFARLLPFDHCHPTGHRPHYLWCQGLIRFAEFAVNFYKIRVCQGESFVGTNPRSLFRITLLDLTSFSPVLVPLKKAKNPRRRRFTTASTMGWGWPSSCRRSLTLYMPHLFWKTWEGKKVESLVYGIISSVALEDTKKKHTAAIAKYLYCNKRRHIMSGLR